MAPKAATAKTNNGMKILETEVLLEKRISFAKTKGKDDDDSTLGDDDDDDDSSLGHGGASQDSGGAVDDDPYGFLAKQHLDASSDESSYWSSSDDDSESDDFENDNEIDEDADEGEDESSKEKENHVEDENSASSLHLTGTDPANSHKNKTPDIISHGDASADMTAAQKKANRRRRDRVKRNDSNLSIDALIKLQMQLGDKPTKATGSPTKKNEMPVATTTTTTTTAVAPVAPTTAPTSPSARRRGRRLNNKEHVTSLGALAKKIGSSTGNEIMDKQVKEAVSKMRRSESATKLPYKPKKMLHIQQPPNDPTTATTTPTKSPSISSSSQRSPHASVNHASSMMMDRSSKSHTAGVTGSPSAAAGAALSPGLKRSSVLKYPQHVKNLVSPRDHYLALMRQANIPAPLISYSELDDFFLPVTAADKAAFDMELVGAVRDQDMDKILELQAAGHPLQARSQFGESLLHVCVRRGTPDMLRYFLQQLGDSCVKVCCDYGRTLLHDAAWSRDAQSLEMMKILIQTCPDLLLILDKTGFMPLDYIPKDRWPHCCAFLDKHKDILAPKGVLFGDDSSSSSDDYDDDESGGSDDDDLDHSGAVDF